MCGSKLHLGGDEKQKIVQKNQLNLCSQDMIENIFATHKCISYLL